MKTLMHGAVLLLLVLLSLPTSSDAFSRRSGGSEFAPTQAVTTPVNGATNNVSAQAVPEPPVLLLMSIGFGVFASAYAVKRFRKQY
jgi:hypothetical protein